MVRPSQPEKREKLLTRCLDAAMASGTLDFSINALAEAAGTSGRMLVYHFGSKVALQKELITLLESRLRDNLLTFQKEHGDSEEGLAASLLALWAHLTRPEIHGLLTLWLALVQRAPHDEQTRQYFIKESSLWMEFLTGVTGDETRAGTLYYLLQGALLDFLGTGRADRGQEILKAYATNSR